MDLATSIEPNSQQVNAEDLLAGERTVTITGVEAGTAEQPVFVHLEQFPGRTYRPSKSMRRLLVNAWGVESSAYVGRQITIFRNPEIRFGSAAVGGIQISAMSHIDKPMTVALTVSRGKRAPFTVRPITTRDWLGELDELNDLDSIKTLGESAKAAGATQDTINTMLAKYRKVEAGA